MKLKLPEGQLSFEDLAQLEKKCYGTVKRVWDRGKFGQRILDGDFSAIDDYLRTPLNGESIGFLSSGSIKEANSAFWPLVEYLQLEHAGLCNEVERDYIEKDSKADTYDICWISHPTDQIERARNAYSMVWDHVIDYFRRVFRGLGDAPPEFLAGVNLMDGLTSTLTLVARVSSEWAAYRLFQRCQGRAYVVFPELGRALFQTKLKGLQSSQLRLPNRVIYVDLRMCEDRSMVDAGNNVMQEISGCYIIESPVVGTSRAWQVLVMADMSGTPTPFSAFCIRWDDHSSIEVSLERSIHADRDRSLSMKKAQDSEFMKSVCDGQTVEEIAQSRADTYDGLFSLLTNIVLYITHPDADAILMDASDEYSRLRERMLQAKGARRERFKAQMRGLGARPRVVLGGSFQLTIDRKGEADRDGLKGGSGGKLSVRCSVMGHWRNQACGEGHLDRKLIWIKPHFRGPDIPGLTKHRKVIVK